MTIYFVRTTGNDTTGDGSTGLPWLTLTKAMTVAVAGDTINVGDGTYIENTAGAGVWNISKNLASFLTIQAENGVAANVIIKGNGTSASNTFIGGASAFLRFNNLTFAQAALSSYSLRINAACANFEFNGCIFDTNTADAAARSGLAHLSATAIASGWVFNNCICTNSPSAGIVASIQLAPTGTGSFSGTFNNCTIAGGILTTGTPTSVILVITGGTISSSTGRAVNANGASLAIANVLISNTAAFTTCQIGVDGTAGNLTTGSLTGCAIQRSASLIGHGLLIGAGCSNFVVDRVSIPQAYDYALVIKENAGAIVRYCTLVGGRGTSANAALYCKAATGVNAHHNRLIAGANYGVRVLKGDTSNKSGTITLVDNRIIARGIAQALDWGDSTHDSGGGICDRNSYDIRSSGRFGSVRASSAIAALSGLRAAWVGYDVPTNDGASRLAARPIVVAP